MIETLPARWYHDPDIFQREREAIFDAGWLVAGHVARVPHPTGAFAARAGGRSVLVVRRADGSLAAFHNVCRHRAAPLLWDGQAEPCATLRCRYHGWRYGLDGALRATPGFGEDVDPEGWGLEPVALRVLHGLLLVCFADTPPPLSEAVDGFADPLGEQGLDGLAFCRSSSHRLRCNWKTYVENYLEGYHIPWLHPALAGEISVRDYHVDVAGRAALHRVPTRAGARSLGFWAWLWPNAAVNVYGRGLNLEVMHPISPTEMEISYTYLFDPALPEADREAAIALSQEVTAEDIQVCEAVQQNLSGGIYRTGRLSPRHEGAVAAFQAWVRAALQ